MSVVYTNGTQIPEGAPGFGEGRGRVKVIEQKYHGWKNILFVLVAALFLPYGGMIVGMTLLSSDHVYPGLFVLFGGMGGYFYLEWLRWRNRANIAAVHSQVNSWWMNPVAKVFCAPCSICCNPYDPIVISTSPLHTRMTKVWVVEEEQAPVQEAMAPPGNVAATIPLSTTTTTGQAASLQPEPSTVGSPSPRGGDVVVASDGTVMEVRKFEWTQQGASIEIAVDKLVNLLKNVLKVALVAAVPGAALLEVAAAFGHAALDGAEAACDAVAEEVTTTLAVGYKQQTAREKITKLFEQAATSCVLIYTNTDKSLVETSGQSCVASLGKFSVSVAMEIVVVKGVSRESYEKVASKLRSKMLDAVLTV